MVALLCAVKVCVVCAVSYFLLCPSICNSFYTYCEMQYNYCMFLVMITICNTYQL